MRLIWATPIAIVALVTLARGKGPQPVPTKTAQPSQIVFSRDILPILSENCFLCHGPDKTMRKAKLRLDIKDGAMRVIVPGKGADSELIQRITATDPHELMPPPKSSRKLTPAQKELLRRWIDQGAPWGKHWAYETLQRPELPAVKNSSWCRNDIDRFILARLEKEGLKPAAEASRETLIRRVTLDLTGLPPTLKELDAFLADRSPDAYEKVVDRLLASERYGERMAMDWLDGARFADTNGFQNDFERSMWPWRDWVIGAFNSNIPFDRFVIEQIAGDMLPGATLEQKIATGFNRNNRTVTEAGSIDEEWHVENIVDRIETTTMVFLGLTMGCARCHDHKYDPITQKEFYRFFAFFNGNNEKGVYTEQRGNMPPLVSVPSAADKARLKQFDVAIAGADMAVREKSASVAAAQEKWEQQELARPAASVAGPLVRFPLDGRLAIVGANDAKGERLCKATVKPNWVAGPFGKVLMLDGKMESFLDAGDAVRLERTDKFSYGGWVKPQGDGAIFSRMDDTAAYRGFDLLVSNGKVDVHMVNTWPANALKVSTKESLPADTWSHVLFTHDGSGKAKGVSIYINGRSVPLHVHNDTLSSSIATPEPLRLGRRSASIPLKGTLTDIRFYGRVLSTGEVQTLVQQSWLAVLKLAPAQRTAEMKEVLSGFFRRNFATGVHEAEQLLTKLRQDKAEYEKKVPTAMVMAELPKPRPTYLLKRGRYDMGDKSQKLEPGVPGCLPPIPQGLPNNRLGLARWLADPANPLTARVAVNRFWQHYFGTGLVKTAENFGVQGEAPSHPDLLDWLAAEFVRGGWNMKSLQKLIVTSAGYRQSSIATPELLKKDPDNRLLARGPRLRLPAEVVRDNALAISGLLVEKIGGPSVKPYQPAGLWDELAGGAASKYVQDKGADLYRRSLYIYRKRTVPHPALSTFDAPSREVCQVKRQRTDTPLQALALLNDVAYVEAARALAQCMLTEGGTSGEQRLTYAFRRATARRPSSAELLVLARALDRYLRFYRVDPKLAQQLVRHGEAPMSGKMDTVELAAYSSTASIILNLDETITKE
jgi:hypothetical protein